MRGSSRSGAYRYELEIHTWPMWLQANEVVSGRDLGALHDMTPTKRTLVRFAPVEPVSFGRTFCVREVETNDT